MVNDRERVRVAVWNALYRGNPEPTEETEFLKAVYTSAAIGGQETFDEPEKLVGEIVARFGESTGSDLSEFVGENGQATRFFYESVLTYLDAEPSNEDASQEADDSEEDETADAFSPVDADAKMFGVDTLYNLIDSGNLDLNPPWQRTVVWSPAKQRELVKSVLLGIPIPSLILHHKNAGVLGKESYSIIDGKQRLTAICRFLRNEFKLPSFAVDPTHPLFPCRSRWYDKSKGKAKALDSVYRTRIMTTQIPVLLFRDVPEGRLRQIFNLYNASSIRLNAAEIRNAVYQNNPIHRMLFVLSGEAANTDVLPFLEPAEQRGFIDTLRAILPSTKRFAALDFLCRYLGYSRAPGDPSNRFTPLSTSAAVNRYLDLCAPQDSPEEIAREIIRIIEKAQNFFDLDGGGGEGHLAFFTRVKDGKRKFEALQAITSMVCARLLDRVAELGAATADEIDRAVRVTIQATSYPEKQQYTTIWDHQARRFLRLAEELDLDLSEFDGGSFKEFADKMGQVRLELD